MSIGKPSPIMMREARKELGVSTSETVMIGDTMETDILGGVQMGYRTLLVLTGTTAPGDLERYAYAPDMMIDSVAYLADPAVDLRNVVPAGDLAADTVPDVRELLQAAS